MEDFTLLVQLSYHLCKLGKMVFRQIRLLLKNQNIEIEVYFKDSFWPLE